VPVALVGELLHTSRVERCAPGLNGTCCFSSSRLYIEAQDASSGRRCVRVPSLSVVLAVSITASAIRWALNGLARLASGKV
jgi:hypothetical protein